MTLKHLFIISALLNGTLATGQSSGDLNLAQSLAHEVTRSEAVSQITNDARRKTALLLSWVDMPPSSVDIDELYIGLADAFGRLKTTDAIPFLIRYISIKRTGVVDLAPWLKTPETIISTFPAIAALIEIGPAASEALIRTSLRAMTPEDRLAAIFTVSRIKGVAESRAFLNTALGYASQQRLWALEGLKLLDGKVPEKGK